MLCAKFDGKSNYFELPDYLTLEKNKILGLLRDVVLDLKKSDSWEEYGKRPSWKMFDSM